MDRKLVSNLLGISEKSYYRWKEERKIFALLENYFTDQDIEEFLNTGKIGKFEKLTYLNTKLILKNQCKYLESFKGKFLDKSLKTSHSIFINFYFSFLVNLKEISLKENIYDLKINDILFSSINTFLLDKYNNSLLEINNLKKETLRSIKVENETNLKDIQKYTSCFKNWNEDMLIYLDYALSDNLQSFLDSNIEEFVFHAVGFNINYYLKNKGLDDDTKSFIKFKMSDFIKNKKNTPIKVNEIYSYIEELLKT